MSKSYESLHTHTVISDGKFTHLDILNMAPKYNIGTVAFTDHDILPDRATLKMLERNRDHRTKWIIGCEFSSLLPKELDKNGKNSLHILGLFLDPRNKDLMAYSKQVLAGRVASVKEKIICLKDLGFDISYKDCRRTDGGAIAKTHLVETMMLKEKNRKIIDLWLEKMAQESKHNLTIKKKYDFLIKRGKVHSPYVFLKDHVYRKDDREAPSLLDLDKVVNLIRGAGGIASLAHWAFSKEVLSLKNIEKLFKDNRLDGAEIIFGSNKDRKVKKEMDEDMRLMKDLVVKYNKIPTGGPDMHTEEDFAYLFSRKSVAKQTIGLTQNIIDKTNVDLKFSSLNRE